MKTLAKLAIGGNAFMGTLWLTEFFEETGMEAVIWVSVAIVCIVINIPAALKGCGEKSRAI